MNLKMAICEDEVLVAHMLAEYLIEMGHKVCALCLEPDEFLEKIKKERPDLAFLDINLNAKINGIELAYQLHQQNIPCIFVTAYSDEQTLANALEQKPVGYLVKPFTKAQLKAQLELVKTQLHRQFMEIQAQGKMYRIDPKELIYIESDRNYTLFHLTDQELRVRGPLKSFITLLPENQFLICHRSFVINKDHLIKYDKENCLMTGNLTVPVGRQHREELDNNLL